MPRARGKQRRRCCSFPRGGKKSTTATTATTPKEKRENEKESTKKKKGRRERRRERARVKRVVVASAHLRSETASHRPRHALRGGYVRLLRLDPPESLFRALFLFCHIRERKRERERVKKPPRSGTNEKKKPTRARACESENDDQKTKSERRTLMMRNGRPYSSNARDMLGSYVMCVCVVNSSFLSSENSCFVRVTARAKFFF